MLNKPINLAVYSDIHLGHRKTPTAHNIENLKLYLPDDPSSNELDMVVLPGDLFDRFLNLPQEDTMDIHRWATYLLKTCKRRDIVLVVLEGTPSHDWKQPQLLEEINSSIGAELHYAPTLSIHHFDKFNIDILFIPDEWSSDNDDTWCQVQSLMTEHQLDKVDFTVMHGQFAYQLPDHVDVPVHKPDRYMSITRHYVFCGHVHKPSTYGPINNANDWPEDYGSIIVPGSFNRLAHGEEEAKGHWRLTVDPKRDDKIMFIENEYAVIYKTVEVSGMSTDEAVEHVDSVISKYPYGSHIRLRALTDDPIASNIEVLMKRYPGFHWTSDRSDKSKKAKETLTDMRAVFKTTPITRDSIDALFVEELKRMGVDDTLAEACLSRLQEVK